MSKSKGRMKLRQYLQEKLQEKIFDPDDKPEDLTGLTMDELKGLHQLDKTYDADERHAQDFEGNSTLYPRCTRLSAHLRPVPGPPSHSHRNESVEARLLAEWRAQAAQGRWEVARRSLR